MLRNFVLVLVAANVLYFAWAHWGANSKPVLTAVPARHMPVGGESPAPASCASLGPFRDETLAARAESRLAGAGIKTLRRDMSVEVNDGWWVYVTSDGSAAQTRAVDAIRRAGQRDAFAIPDDPEFRVSVGVLSDSERAADLATRIRALKFEPQIEERRKQQEEVWFDVPDVTREALGDGRLNDLDLPLLDLTIEACPAA